VKVSRRWSSDAWENPRLVIFSAVLVVWLVTIVFRLYYLQVERHDHFRDKAEEQQQKVVSLDAPRGTIFDARGRQLAVSVETVSIGVFPKRVKDPDHLAGVLANLLGLKKRELLAKFSNKKKGFTWVVRKIDPARAEKIRELRLQGVELLPESKRFYPMGSLAAQVLGYVGTDNKGLAGLEFLYERDVVSERGQRTVVRDGLHGTMLDPDLDQAAAKPGKDLHLTIDAVLQQIVERELQEGVARTNAKKGMAVMLDPDNGAILAMASWPTFDPNDFGAYSKASWRNQPVMDAFEPGSTFKMVTLAAALEAHKVDLLDNFFCGNGQIVLYGTRINDHKSFGQLTVREIIAKSSNVGAIHLGRAAGTERLYATIEAFGFGRATGIDLPSENPGLLRPVEKWSPITPAYVSFGQGISITALQLTNSFAAIANGGRLLRPYVVSAVGARKAERAQRTQVMKLPVSPASVRLVRSALESVVVEGTAKAAGVHGYRAAGKTGTAQKAGKGGYLANRYVSSFVGFAPVEDTAFVMAVVLDEPWPAYHGGDAAAPIFGKIASQALLYLGVRPERDPQDQLWPGQRPEPAPGTVLVSAEPADQAPVDVFVPPPGTLPSFVDLTARQALALASRLGLQPTLVGHGVVIEQNPPAGTPLEAAGELELRFGSGPHQARLVAVAKGAP
jgi:cell division protein FtsI (penicillin-binding protein 3)